MPTSKRSSLVRTIRTTAAVSVIGLLSAQMAIGAPGAILKVPAPPAASGSDKPTVVASGDNSVATQTGAFQYSVPIVVPPGRLGNAPKLALSYSSQAPIYGGIAAGWSLTGLPEIVHDVSDGRQGSDTVYVLNGGQDVLGARTYASEMAGRHRVVKVTEPSGTGVKATYRAMYDSSYAQYRMMDDSAGYLWEVRQTDGSIQQFGHTAHITGDVLKSRAPLTKSIDKFGNTVSYFYEGGTDYTPKRIEYTTNEDAGLSQYHATVEFEFAAPKFCAGSTVPIGSQMVFSSAEIVHKGARRLDRIVTSARSKADGALRAVRTINLAYNEDAEACDKQHSPQRQLISVQQTAFSETAASVVLPPVTFSYGPLERTLTQTRVLNVSGITGAPSSGALVWGRRYNSTHRWPTVDSMLMDFDGDGFQDRLFVDRNAFNSTDGIKLDGTPGYQCSFRWQRGGPDGFGLASEPIGLPTLPWNIGNNETPDADNCSLNGQLVNLKNRHAPAECGSIGSYLIYRFLNVAGKDGLPDVVAALHHDVTHFSFEEAGGLLGLGLEQPSCGTGSGGCPAIPNYDDLIDCAPCESTDLSCGQYGRCEPLPDQVYDAAWQAPRMLCAGQTRTQGTDSEGNTYECDTVTVDYGEGPVVENLGNCQRVNVCDGGDGPQNHDSCLPGDPPEQEPDEPPQVHCRSVRVPQTACNESVWHVWKNLGNGELAANPATLLAPVPLESMGGDSAVTAHRRGVVSSDHGIMDLNGDGHLDLFTRDPHANSDSPTSNAMWWWVWFGDGDGGFHGVDDTNRKPFAWWGPLGFDVSKSEEGPGFEWTGQTSSWWGVGVHERVRTGLQKATIADINGDGLPDYLRVNPGTNRTDVHYNNGLGFSYRTTGSVPLVPDTPDELDAQNAISAMRTNVAGVETGGKWVTHAIRSTVQDFIDVDGDGRIDRYSPSTSSSVPVNLSVNAGGSITEARPLTGGTFLGGVTGPLEQVQVDETYWWVNRRFVDLTGDGRPDVFGDAGPGTIRTDAAHASSRPERLLHTVNNGRGKKIEVAYAVHTDDMVVTQDPAAGKATSNHTWVVKQLDVTVSGTTDITSTSTYRYVNPTVKPDWRGRHGFRGFEQVATTAPSGAITVDRYGYDVDWSGRLVEQVTYETAGKFNNATASDAKASGSQPHSISRTHWAEKPILDGAVRVYVSDAKRSWTCASGQTKSQCLVSGVQRSVATEWTPMPSSTPQLYVASEVHELAGPSGASGSIDMWAYGEHADDRYVKKTFELENDEDLYLLRPMTTEKRTLTGDALVARSEFKYGSSWILAPESVSVLVDVNSGVSATTKTIYDQSTGLPMQVMKPCAVAATNDPNTNCTTGFGLSSSVEYDNYKVHAVKATNELGHEVETDVDYGTGVTTAVRGPNKKHTVGGVSWQTTQTNIDGLGRPTAVFSTVDDPATGGYRLVETTRNTYFDGNATQPASVTTEQNISFLGGWTNSKTTYDGAGRPIETREWLGASSYAVTTYKYDNTGALRELHAPNPASPTPGTADPVVYTTNYDSLGRVIETRSPNAAGVDTVYDGTTITQKEIVAPVATTDDPAGTTFGPDEAPGAEKTLINDAFGRLVQVHETREVGDPAITRYEYDASDRMTKITDAENNVTGLHYDLAGRRVRITRGAKTWYYGYDLNGNMTTVASPPAVGPADPLYTTSIEYDPLGRVLSRMSAVRDLTADQLTEQGGTLTTYTYDGCDDQTCPTTGNTGNALGQLTKVGLPVANITYEYDARGNPITEQRAFDLTTIPGGGDGFKHTRTIRRAFTNHGALAYQAYADGDSVATTQAPAPVGSIPAPLAPELTSLTLSAGTLTNFDPTTLTYDLSVDVSVSETTVTPTALDPAAEITVNGTSVSSANATQPIPLDLGENLISVVVNAGGATRTYEVTISRGASVVEQVAYVKSSNTNAGDYFGKVALSGDTLAVAAVYESSDATGVNGDQHNNNAYRSGAVYVFRRNGSTWSQEAYIKASNTAAWDRFGYSIALEGDTLVVGAPTEDSIATGANGDDSDNSATNSGAVYVFQRSGTTWSQQAYLKAHNTHVARPPVENDWFGANVALSGSTLVVGAPFESTTRDWSGAVYVFERSGASWSQQAFLKAPNPVASDRFGGSVSVSGDSLIVGVPYEDGGADGAGAAYVFRRSGTTWYQEAYLKASNAGTGDAFGIGVSISGDIAVVGAHLEDSSATGVDGNGNDGSAVNSGAAYIYQRTGASWSQTAYLKPSNTAADSVFGLRVAVSGDVVAVGAYKEDSTQADSGAVYVFRPNSAGWVQTDHLKASSPGQGDGFGTAVAVDGDMIAVGAAFEDSSAVGFDGAQSSNGAPDSGAGYVFQASSVASNAPEAPVLAGLALSSGPIPDFDGATTAYRVEVPVSTSTTTVTATLASPSLATITVSGAEVASGAATAAVPLNLGDNMISVVVAAGGSSRAYSLTISRGPAVVDQIAYLKSSNTNAGDYFGNVALSGDTLAVGAIYESSSATGVNGDQHNNDSYRSGAVYVFRRTGSMWAQEAYIKASNADAWDRFGYSVALDGDTLVVGAPAEDSIATGVNGDASNNSATNSGAVYVFQRSGTTWSQQAYIKAHNTHAAQPPVENDWFGASVALSGSTLVVGAPFESTMRDWSGAAYVFERSGNTWIQQAFLKSPNPAVSDRFGQGVAVSGDTIVAGVPYEDGVETSAGAAYVFRRSGSTWSQEAHLKASNAGAGDAFGYRVAISGDTVVAGAHLEDSSATGVNGDGGDNSAVNSGAAYVYQRSATSWNQTAYLKPSTASANGYFGIGPAVSGDVIAVGGYAVDGLVAGSGAVSLYRATGSAWAQTNQLTASNAGSGDGFGNMVAISGDLIVVGGYSEDGAGTGVNPGGTSNGAPDSGAAYLFDVAAPNVPVVPVPISQQPHPGNEEVTTPPETTIQSAGATVIATEFDARGAPNRVTWLRREGAHLLGSLDRHAAGMPRSRISFGLPATAGGTPVEQTRGWAYDELGRVKLDMLQRPSGMSTLAAITYHGTGDVKTLTSYLGHTVQYAYDARHQLKRAEELTQGGNVESVLTYTKAGRIDTASVQAPTNGMPNVRERNVVYRYSGDSSTPEQLDAMEHVAGSGNYAEFAYDARGAVTERTIRGDGTGPPQTWKMVYDGDGRMRKLERPGGGSELYFYDHNGQRMLALERTAGSGSAVGAVKLREWFGGTEVHYDALGTETKTRAHVALAGPLARIEDRGDVTFTYHNGLGHLVLATGNDGADKVAYSYTAFGEVFDQTGDVGGHLRRFNGKEVDAESGLAYYGYRYYDPVAMQWTRADPLFRFVPDRAFGEPRRGNLYVFSLNNATRYLDPDGLAASDMDLNAKGDARRAGPKKKKPRKRAVASPGPMCSDDGGGQCTVTSYEEINGNRFVTYKSGAMLISYQGGAFTYVKTKGLFLWAKKLSRDAARYAQNPDPRVEFATTTLPKIMATAQFVYSLAAPGGLLNWGRGTAVAGTVTLRGEPLQKGFIYRTGSQTDNALTDPTGVSFRNSISSSADGKQVFRPGDKLYAVDTAKLPSGSVVPDNVPAGHVTVNASPEQIRAAIVPQGSTNPIQPLGMKPLQDGSSYRLPKK